MNNSDYVCCLLGAGLKFTHETVRWNVDHAVLDIIAKEINILNQRDRLPAAQSPTE